ncbi:MAG: hypothetical protein PHP35_01040 [Candidatus Colwellbacteria bacterium]|nr:hypothetical protein [Candidatus Colwellbacteria bacterium]
MCSVQPYTPGGSLVPPGLTPENADWCAVWQLLSNALGIFLYIAVSAAVIVTAIGGIYILTAADNESRRKQGLGMVRASLIGVAIVIAANTIVRGIFMALGISDLPSWLQ